MSPQRSEIIGVWQLDGRQPNNMMQLCKDGFTWSMFPDTFFFLKKISEYLLANAQVTVIQ